MLAGRIMQGTLVLAVAASLAGAAFLTWRATAGEGAAIEFMLPTPAPPSAVAAEIKVYVTGAVVMPGVYSLRDGARLHELVEAASPGPGRTQTSTPSTWRLASGTRTTGASRQGGRRQRPIR